MKTRKQYMNNECSHHDYYLQFVPESLIRYFQNYYTLGALTELFEADEHLNNFPMMDIDAIANLFKFSIARLNREANGGELVWSPSLGCSTVKSAIIEIVLRGKE